jgi:hypothetical protein
MTTLTTFTPPTTNTHLIGNPAAERVVDGRGSASQLKRRSTKDTDNFLLSRREVAIP